MYLGTKEPSREDVRRSLRRYTLGMDQALMVGSAFVTRAPLYLVWVGAIVYSLFQLERHPSASRWALGGFGALLIVSILGTIVSVLLPSALIQQGKSAADVGVQMAIYGGAQSIVSAAAWCLIIVAIYRGRS